MPRLWLVDGWLAIREFAGRHDSLAAPGRIQPMKLLLAAGAVAVALVAADASGAAARLRLSSPAFGAGKPIPRVYTCDGRGMSPPLRWTAPPPGTRSFALRVYDTDAGFAHWLGWGISSRSRGLSSGQRPPRQGRNDFGRIGYGGPCPPRGTAHHYVFTLYALTRPLRIPSGSADDKFLAALKAARVLAQAKLVGTYERR